MMVILWFLDGGGLWEIPKMCMNRLTAPRLSPWASHNSVALCIFECILSWGFCVKSIASMKNYNCGMLSMKSK